MTKTVAISAMAGLMTVCAWAEVVYTEENPPPRMAFEKRTPEEQVAYRKFIAEHKLIKTGGEIPALGSGLGCVLILDTQTRFTTATNVINEIVKLTKLPITYKKAPAPEAGDPAAALAAHGANVVIFIVDDKQTPAILAAPDDYWVKMNVAKLDNGQSGVLAGRLFAQRCRKELHRAFAFACGGISSQFNKNAFDTARIADLDTVKEFLPVDMPPRYEAYLKQLGVTPKTSIPYVRACMEGWAPAPSNKYQKAVWDRVHALPTDPIKIKYDKKKGE